MLTRSVLLCRNHEETFLRSTASDRSLSSTDGTGVMSIPSGKARRADYEVNK
ncbi:hypothetical protein CHS0354_011923 [Potamilus streckersoni]|uniref:Uncharacterized protein n=1 Tax=Potamilus streckersoni TaxID=2493646 RepID=A0AAE0W4L6_9BIVA|nr:hypothetical protein CHS0354_011923 [Potamilus streckersoni]